MGSIDRFILPTSVSYILGTPTDSITHAESSVDTIRPVEALGVLAVHGALVIPTSRFRLPVFF